MKSVIMWIVANKMVFGWAVVGAFVVLTKPRTPEQFDRIAKLSPRLGHILRAIAKLGPDYVGFARAMLDVVFGTNLTATVERALKSMPPPAAPAPPTPPSDPL